MAKKNKTVARISMLSLLLLAACTSTSTTGRQFQESSVDNIKIGSTTKSQVSQMLGEPYSRNVAANGNEMWTYTYVQSTKTGAPGLYDMWFSGTQEVQSKALTINFSNDRVSECTLIESQSSASGTQSQRILQMGALGSGTRVETKCSERAG